MPSFFDFCGQFGIGIGLLFAIRFVRIVVSIIDRSEVDSAQAIRAELPVFGELRADAIATAGRVAHYRASSTSLRRHAAVSASIFVARKIEVLHYPFLRYGSRGSMVCDSR